MLRPLAGKSTSPPLEANISRAIGKISYRSLSKIGGIAFESVASPDLNSVPYYGIYI